MDGKKGNLDILFTSPKEHSKGIGYAAWCEVGEATCDHHDHEHHGDHDCGHGGCHH